VPCFALDREREFRPQDGCFSDGYVLVLDSCKRSIERLDAVNIYHEIAAHTANALMIKIPVPGERWEIEILDDGQIQIEIFRSNGHIFVDEEVEPLINRLFDEFSD